MIAEVFVMLETLIVKIDYAIEGDIYINVIKSYSLNIIEIVLGRIVHQAHYFILLVNN